MNKVLMKRNRDEEKKIKNKKVKTFEFVKLTSEQNEFVNSEINLIPRHIIAVQAHAAAGKTITMELFFRNHPESRFLMLYFNKNIADSSKKKLKDLSNCICHTYHGLAYAIIVQQHGYKLFMPSIRAKYYNQCIQNYMKKIDLLDDFADRFKFQNRMAWKDPAQNKTLWIHALATLDEFCYSADTIIEEKHCVRLNANEVKIQNLPNKKDVLILANYILSIIVKGELKTINHPLSIKLLHLKKIDLSKMFEVIALDEAQDCFPVMMEVMMNQNVAYMVVGDSNQSILGWIHAKNAITNLCNRIPKEHQIHFTLSESFRFGPSIAKLCNNLFEKMKHPVAKPFSSHRVPDTVIVECPTSVLQMASQFSIVLNSKKIPKSESIAVISRTKSDILEFINCCIEESHFNFKCSPAVKEDLDQVIEWGSMNDAELRQKINQIQYQIVMNSTDDELKSKCKMMEYVRDKAERKEFCGKLKALIHPRINTTSKEDRIDIYIMTCHACKGLEFDHVFVLGLHKELETLQQNSIEKSYEDALFLMYVTITRCKKSLYLPSNIYQFLTMH